MRILHIDTGMGWRGGQQQALWLLEGCRDRGIEQRLLAPAGSPLAERAGQSGIDVSELSPRALTLKNLRTVRGLASGYDVVHAHDAHAHSLLCAVHPFRSARSPALLVSRRVGFPVGKTGRGKYRIPDLYIAVSRFVRWQLIEAAVEEEKIRVVLDGVRVPLEHPGDRLREEYRHRHGAEDGTFVLGTLSSFAPEKLLLEELKLLQQLPPATHFWLGVPDREPDPGSAGARLMDAAGNMGLAGRFRIVPVGEEPGPLLASLDLFVYFSRMEGLGSAILLAMAHGLAVVASNVGGIPEIVCHGQTGVLVGEDGWQELPGAVKFLMASPETLRRMGAAARHFVLANGSSDRMVAQTVHLYQELMQRSLEPGP